MRPASFARRLYLRWVRTETKQKPSCPGCWGMRAFVKPARWRRSDPAHAQIFDLEEILDAVFRAFAAGAGFLHAAERRYFGGDDAGVDADDAGLDLFGRAPHPADIAGVEV